MAFTPNGLYVPDSLEGYDNDPDGSITWVRRLEQKIAYRNLRLATYDDYYRGYHRLQFATPKFETTFGSLFHEFADNWVPLVVDAVTERLHPNGFRMGTDSDKGDQDAWRIWQANGMDSEISLGFTEAVLREESYLQVWNDPDDQETPSITVEDPGQMIVAYSPENRRKLLAACKFFVDEDGYPCATLWLPDWCYKYRSMTVDYRAADLYQEQLGAIRDNPAGGGTWSNNLSSAISGQVGAPTPVVGQPRVWVPRIVDDELWPLPNPLGRVPVVPIRNKPRLLGEPESEVHHVIPLQDACNKFMTDMLLASEFAAFPQRWATGLDIPIDPITKEPRKLPTGPGSLLASKNKDAKFGVFPEMSGDAHIKAIQTVVQHIASQSRTPPHYFYLNGQFPSGESIKSAETGLVSKVRSRMTVFGEALESAMRLGFAVLGDSRAKIVDSETIWADPESRTESEHVDAVIKRIAIGVPLRQLQEDVGYSQAQIERFRDMRRDEIQDYVLAQAQALAALAAAGTPDPTQQGAGGAGGAGGQTGAQGQPVGLPNPTAGGQRDNYISVPGAPAAFDVRGARTTL